MSDAMELSDRDRVVLLAVLDDVLVGRAYFSHGEMKTITNWSIQEATHLVEELRGGKRFLSATERPFVGASIYHWWVAAKYGRTVATDGLRSEAWDLRDRMHRSRSPKE